MDAEQIVRIVQVINHWPKAKDLAVFASEHRGYGDSNGGFGVIYPGDLDDFDREIEGADIPLGHVQVYGFWGAPKGGYEFIAEEAGYLGVLANVLRDQSLSAEADAVQLLVRSLNK